MGVNTHRPLAAFVLLIFLPVVVPVRLPAMGWRVGLAGAERVNPRSDTTVTRLDAGRFSILAWPADQRLARSLLGAAMAHDTFPGLPRPVAHVIIVVAPNAAQFRRWVGTVSPEWGAAVAFPDLQRIVVQGGAATSAAGDPIATLRHELAHLALHESLDDLPPRWFDEGYASYAANEAVRDNELSNNVALALRGVPTLASLDTGLVGGQTEAMISYALAYRAVSDLASLDRFHGLSLMFSYWRASGSLDTAIRRAYGESLDAFETEWRARTKRRYGTLALVSDLAFATIIFLVLLAPLYGARRRRDRLRLTALRAQEVAEAAAAATAVSAILGQHDDATDRASGRGSPERPV